MIPTRWSANLMLPFCRTISSICICGCIWRMSATFLVFELISIRTLLSHQWSSWFWSSCYEWESIPCAEPCADIWSHKIFSFVIQKSLYFLQRFSVSFSPSFTSSFLLFLPIFFICSPITKSSQYVLKYKNPQEKYQAYTIVERIDLSIGNSAHSLWSPLFICDSWPWRSCPFFRA